MIKIINGTYGYRNPHSGLVEAKTVKSKPFSLSPDREDELVDAGVAEYVGEDVSDDTPDDHAPETDDAGYSEKNTVAELKAIAKERGIEVAERATKKQILAALEAAEESGDDDDSESGEDGAENDESGDNAPSISAALPE